MKKKNSIGKNTEITKIYLFHQKYLLYLNECNGFMFNVGSFEDKNRVLKFDYQKIDKLEFISFDGIQHISSSYLVLLDFKHDQQIEEWSKVKISHWSTLYQFVHKWSKEAFDQCNLTESNIKIPV